MLFVQVHIPSRIIWKLRINLNSFIVPCWPALIALFSYVFEEGLVVFKLGLSMVEEGDRRV